MTTSARTQMQMICTSVFDIFQIKLVDVFRSNDSLKRRKTLQKRPSAISPVGEQPLAVIAVPLQQCVSKRFKDDQLDRCALAGSANDEEAHETESYSQQKTPKMKWAKFHRIENRDTKQILRQHELLRLVNQRLIFLSIHYHAYDPSKLAKRLFGVSILNV